MEVLTHLAYAKWGSEFQTAHESEPPRSPSLYHHRETTAIVSHLFLLYLSLTLAGIISYSCFFLRSLCITNRRFLFNLTK